MMKHLYHKTYWTPDEAHAILMFLDELRDLIWHSYGNEIMTFHQTSCPSEEDNKDESFDDPIPF